jgi:hypothetical protein
MRYPALLTCFGVNRVDTRLYYLVEVKPWGEGFLSDVWEVGWSGTKWFADNVTAEASGNPPPATAPQGSGLTCFGVNGTDSRVYYYDNKGNVWELGWNGHWFAGNVTAQATGNPPPGLALTCFGVNGTDSRVSSAPPFPQPCGRSAAPGPTTARHHPAIGRRRSPSNASSDSRCNRSAAGERRMGAFRRRW